MDTTTNDLCTTYDGAYDVRATKIEAGARIVMATVTSRNRPALTFGTVVGFIEPDLDCPERVLIRWDRDAEDDEPDELYRTHDYYDYEGYFNVLVIG